MSLLGSTAPKNIGLNWNAFATRWERQVDRILENELNIRIIGTHLIHSGIREEQARIIVGYRRARVHIFVTLALEEVYIGLPYLLRVHAAHYRDISMYCNSEKVEKAIQIPFALREQFAIWPQVASDAAGKREITSNNETKHAQLPLQHFYDLWWRFRQILKKDNDQIYGTYRQRQNSHGSLSDTTDPRGFADERGEE